MRAWWGLLGVVSVGTVLACGGSKTGRGGTPVVGDIVVSPEEAALGQRVTVAASATDPDGSLLRYAWTVPDGWEVEGAVDGPALTLRAPFVPSQTGALVLWVANPAGKTSSKVALVRTAPLPGAPAVVFRSVAAGPNPAPPGGAIDVAAIADSADGAAVRFRVDVSDPAWTATALAGGARVTAPLAYGRAATLTLFADGTTGGRAVARMLLATKPYAAPRIDAVAASPAVTPPGATIQLSAAATSADGLPLAYAWSIAGDGWTISASGADAVATAPARAGASATVTVTATDAAGATATGSTALATSDAVPALASFGVQPAQVAPGGTIAASAVASGAAGASVTYAWSVQPAGWTVTASGGTAIVHAPLAWDAAAVLTVTASDPFRSVTASRLLATSPLSPPRISWVMAVPQALLPGGTAQLAVDAASPAGLPLSYRWSVQGAGWAIAGGGADAVLTAPAAPAQAAIASVTVTDAAGASSTAALAVTTTSP